MSNSQPENCSKTEKKKKKKTPRCAYEGCRKKLSAISLSLTCRCNKVFCPLHRLPESHKCTFDYKNDNNLKQCVKVEELKCVADKIIRI